MLRVGAVLSKSQKWSERSLFVWKVQFNIEIYLGRSGAILYTMHRGFYFVASAGVFLLEVLFISMFQKN